MSTLLRLLVLNIVALACYSEFVSCGMSWKSAPKEDGVVQPWTTWTACYPRDGPAKRTRTQRCSVARFGGSQTCDLLEMPPVDSEDCEPVQGNWADWEAWGQCYGVCRETSPPRTRYRSCTSPAPLYGGAECPGLAEEKQNCTHLPQCFYEWNAWGAWAACDQCTMSRERTCEVADSCIGISTAVTSCPCPSSLFVLGGGLTSGWTLINPMTEQSWAANECLPKHPGAQTWLKEHALTLTKDNEAVTCGGIPDSYGAGDNEIAGCFLLDINVENSAWQTLPDLPSPRKRHAMASWSNFVYVFGGFSKDILQLDLSQSSSGWTVVSTLPQQRQHSTSVQSGSSLYIIGGVDGESDAFLRSVLLYDLEQPDTAPVTLNELPLTAGVLKAGCGLYDSSIVCVNGLDVSRGMSGSVAVMDVAAPDQGWTLQAYESPLKSLQPILFSVEGQMLMAVDDALYEYKASVGFSQLGAAKLSVSVRQGFGVVVPMTKSLMACMGF